jgi:hypothetical protein
LSDQSYWICFPSGKVISPLKASINDGDALVQIEGAEEVCVTFGIFEENRGTYGWRVSAPPPGANWTLDHEASARKDYRVCLWRRPR